MGEGPEAPREPDPALEEIRRLFARYREHRRFGRVAEREETLEEPEQDQQDEPPGRDE
jgi:hypothetical protein